MINRLTPFFIIAQPRDGTVLDNTLQKNDDFYIHYRICVLAAISPDVSDDVPDSG